MTTTLSNTPGAVFVDGDFAGTVTANPNTDAYTVTTRDGWHIGDYRSHLDGIDTLTRIAKDRP